MRTNLKVPYAEKDEAHRLGAKWDDVRKVWYVENHPKIWLFNRWLPDHLKSPDWQAKRVDKAMRKFWG